MINNASFTYRENALLNPCNMTLNFYRPSKHVYTRDYLQQSMYSIECHKSDT